MASDPINPAHYNGKACALIGQYLTGNSYQVLKYNWRLGRKDAVLIEMDKSIWYLDEEITLANAGWRSPTVFMLHMGGSKGFPENKYFEDLLRGQDEFVVAVAWLLIGWTKHGDKINLAILRDMLISHRARLETEQTGQITLEV